MKEYLNICRNAVRNEGIFNNFRSYAPYINVVEACGESHGQGYLDWIKKEVSIVIDWERVCLNDTVGNPKLFKYKGLDKPISPTTLRYVKVTAELFKIFGSLGDRDIVEIGVGYGGLCKMIHNYCTPKSYTLVDLPDVLKLTSKYLDHFNIKNLVFKTSDSDFKTPSDLCISNYAFSEIQKEFQEIYVDKIIEHTEKGYMICNCLGRNGEYGMSFLEILKLKVNGFFVREDPLTSEENALYVWGSKTNYFCDGI